MYRLKMLRALIAVSILILTEPSFAAPSRDETLSYIASILESCNYVSKVQRNDSHFRLYFNFGVLEQFREFDLNEFKTPDKPNDIITVAMLNCNSGACVKVFGSTYNKEWDPLQPESAITFLCSTAETDLMKALRYYLLNFGAPGLVFPDE